MHLRKYSFSLIPIALAFLASCGPDAEQQPQPDPVAVDHADIQATVLANGDALSAEIMSALTYLEASPVVEDFLDVDADAPCPVDVETGDSSCADDPPLSEDVEEARQEFLGILEDGVFIDANVESDDAHQITYLLAGAEFCAALAPEDSEDIAECEADIDALEIRLVASSPSQSTLSIDVEVGPERRSPLNIYLADSQLAAELDLTAIKDLESHLADLFDEEVPAFDFPQTLEGILLLDTQIDGQRVDISLSAVESIHVESPQFELAMPQKSSFAALSVDHGTERVDALIDVPALSGALEVEGEQIDSVEAPEPMMVGLELPALSAGLGFADADGQVVFESVLPEAEPVQLLIDDEAVLQAHLNANLNGEVTRDGDETTMAVDELFDLELLFAFAAVQDKLSDLAQWMHDDVLHLSLSGADKPAVRFGADNLEVLRGTLQLAADSADVNTTVEAGQCLVEADGGAEHPFAQVMAGVCSE